MLVGSLSRGLPGNTHRVGHEQLTRLDRALEGLGEGVTLIVAQLGGATLGERLTTERRVFGGNQHVPHGSASPQSANTASMDRVGPYCRGSDQR